MAYELAGDDAGLVALDCARAGTALLLPFTDAVWQIYVLIFVLNACSAGFTPVFQATIPDMLRDEDRPALFSAHFALSHLCWLGVYPVVGWLGGRAGFEMAFASLVLIVLAAMLAAMVFWPRNDPIEVDHSHVHIHRPVRHRHAFVIDYHHRQWP